MSGRIAKNAATPAVVCTNCRLFILPTFPLLSLGVLVADTPSPTVSPRVAIPCPHGSVCLLKYTKASSYLELVKSLVRGGMPAVLVLMGTFRSSVRVDQPDHFAAFQLLQTPGRAAAEWRLPITVPNPAQAQFVARESTDPRDERRALSATRARPLLGMPSGHTALDARDRAILRFFLYSGARLGTGCRMKVSDFPRMVKKPQSGLTRWATSGARLGFIALRRKRSRNTYT